MVILQHSVQCNPIDCTIPSDLSPAKSTHHQHCNRDDGDGDGEHYHGGIMETIKPVLSHYKPVRAPPPANHNNHHDGDGDE